MKLLFVFLIVQLFVAAGITGCHNATTAGPRGYYLSASGNDENDGSRRYPWKTIQKLNRHNVAPGDSVLFEGGKTFTGKLLIDSNSGGSERYPLLISSYGDGHAKINGGNASALVLYRTKYVTLKNLDLLGSGRKSGNTKDGLSLINCDHITLDSLDITGFQKSGFLIYSSTDILASHIYAHENGAAGIAVEAGRGKKESRNIQIRNCRAENNPGDPTNLTNHSGNGIVAGHCTNLLIERCKATNNGWDMPRIGNGPVGIWCYESDSVTIQHCLSYRNKTSVGGADGGGFDLDGGVTNSVIQYNLSYENQGSGYCIFQYWGASPWYNNVIRFNISENDGLVSDSRAGIYVWNSSGDASQFHDCLVYNNTVYNEKEAAVSYSEKSERKRFGFYNNIFVAKDSLIRGIKGEDVFLGNNWWSLKKRSGKMPGLNRNPHFTNPGNTRLTSFPQAMFHSYDLPSMSVLRNHGVDIHRMPELTSGNTSLIVKHGDIDFNGRPVPARGIGACF
ncbi:MAG TPA: right-handed parallel beta-helix repeat-containing protein [Puia sp.]|nr:right-handed parallel beta-helix repeat-containing protein [Puia sp.]